MGGRWLLTPFLFFFKEHWNVHSSVMTFKRKNGNTFPTSNFLLEEESPPENSCWRGHGCWAWSLRDILGAPDEGISHQKVQGDGMGRLKCIPAQPPGLPHGKLSHSFPSPVASTGLHSGHLHDFLAILIRSWKFLNLVIPFHSVLSLTMATCFHS